MHVSVLWQKRREMENAVLLLKPGTMSMFSVRTYKSQNRRVTCYTSRLETLRLSIGILKFALIMYRNRLPILVLVLSVLRLL